MSSNKSSNNLPVEVSLVNDVKTCRTCKWFWGGIPPYGPYPSYDWSELYPKDAQKILPQSTENMELPWLKSDATGYKLIDPAVMHGCRKAPIMTIGINPNLTSFQPKTTGARWCYPNFSEDANYAFYYRYQTIFQESFSLELMRENLIIGSELRAEADGWLVNVKRTEDHRWMLIEVKYKDRKYPVFYELAWTTKSRYIVLFDKCYDTSGETQFKAGDVIAGELNAPDNQKAEVFENSTGYYQRFIYVLQSFKKMVGGELEHADLRIGEDVAQHDMIACASPGWSSTYDIPQDRITYNCVEDQAYVVSQFIQSQPKVLVIVGGSSLSMFATVFAPYMDLQFENKDIYDLLRETTSRKRYVTIDIDGLSFKSRIITSPHFSYYQNFLEQSRFSPEAWQAFKNDFNDDYTTLENEKLVQPPAYNGVIAVRIDPNNEELKSKISAQGWNVLMAYYFDPYNMMANVLKEEYEEDSFGYDSKSGRLTRAEGPCQYCDNSLWKFPRGCDYNNINEKPYEPGYLGSIVQKILNGQ
ncbi:MAG: hypothetical protein PVH88_17385 [Ignavibacteria bacterium]|jgi:hypothetical protein